MNIRAELAGPPVRMRYRACLIPKIAWWLQTEVEEATDVETWSYRIRSSGATGGATGAMHFHKPRPVRRL